MSARGHRLRALVRDRERAGLACEMVVGDALDAASFRQHVAPADTLVQLVGVPRPAPWKARQFRAVDGVAARAAIEAALAARVAHFVYLSVAQPAPVMRAYVEVRAECERLLAQSGMHASVLRPWYVLGPGHRWPLFLLPAYHLLENIPATREFALRLGLVSIDQMIAALVWTIEHPAREVRILDVPRIRELAAIFATGH